MKRFIAILSAVLAWLAGAVTLLRTSEVGAVALGDMVDAKLEIDETSDMVTLGDDIAAGSATGIWHDYATITVPDGVTLVMLPESVLQVYLEDNEGAPAEMGNYTPVRLVHKDNVSQGTFNRASCLYVNAKFNANRNEQKKLDDKWKVKAKELVVIQVKVPSASSIDVSDCHFSLSCRRIAPMLTP